MRFTLTVRLFVPKDPPPTDMLEDKSKGVVLVKFVSLPGLLPKGSIIKGLAPYTLVVEDYMVSMDGDEAGETAIHCTTNTTVDGATRLQRYLDAGWIDAATCRMETAPGPIPAALLPLVERWARLVETSTNEEFTSWLCRACGSENCVGDSCRQRLARLKPLPPRR